MHINVCGKAVFLLANLKNRPYYINISMMA